MNMSQLSASQCGLAQWSAELVVKILNKRDSCVNVAFTSQSPLDILHFVVVVVFLIL